MMQTESPLNVRSMGIDQISGLFLGREVMKSGKTQERRNVSIIVSVKSKLRTVPGFNVSTQGVVMLKKAEREFELLSARLSLQKYWGCMHTY